MPGERKVNRNAFLLFKDEGSEIKGSERCDPTATDSARCHPADKATEDPEHLRPPSAYSASLLTKNILKHLRIIL